MTEIERRGSSKSVTSSGIPGLVDLTDLGFTSVFDIGAIEGFQSEAIAQARTAQSVCLFKFMESLGIPNHFVEQLSATTIRVRECRIFQQPIISGKVFGNHCNLEILFRIRASQKFIGRVERGEVSVDCFDLGDSDGLRAGSKFSRPFVESSTKWEEKDRYVADKEAAHLANLSLSELCILYSRIRTYAVEIDRLFSSLGFELDDGKCEAAAGEHTHFPTVIDVSTLDELGLRKGDIHYGKNLIRHYYQKNNPVWHQSLLRLKSEHPTDKTQWPQCPPLPKSLIDKHIAHYEEVAELLLRTV